MAVRIGPAIIDALLLGPANQRRQLQDFPVLADVWASFADQPGTHHDLLITPTWERPAGRVAKLLSDGVKERGNSGRSRDISYLQDIVVAKLCLDDLSAIVLPASTWWDKVQDAWKKAPRAEDYAQLIRSQFELCRCEEPGAEAVEKPKQDDLLRLESLDTQQRQAVKLGTLLGVLFAAAAAEEKPGPQNEPEPRCETMCDVFYRLGIDTIAQTGAQAIVQTWLRGKALIKDSKQSDSDWHGVIYLVCLNRKASPAVADSVPAIKGDAARLLFSVKCKDINWAILDSGIDLEHPAFRDHSKKEGAGPAPAGSTALQEGTRIKGTFDFGEIRRILSLDHLDSGDDPGELALSLARKIRKFDGKGKAADAEILAYARVVQGLLKGCAKDLDEERPTDWSKIRPLIERRNPERPDHPHGTHVAGILGADWREDKDPDKSKMVGVCPDISLYDFRVLGVAAEESEFAVIAALQFIRYLNDKSGYSLIHGINMSLSIPHNVRNYACGRTPVCIEADALVANGVVVVAAAGNFGFQQYRLGDNSVFESYASSSITDPGNADGVITVGATHRHWPHTYGVSFFSSRGPTGDGRMKPDILAPGEKIVSCIPGSTGRSDQMDGTSMAAPHVSGAAALLMARHKELQGQPARIKKILCDTATDLNRERSFQGHGMVDVLRAIQTI